MAYVTFDVTKPDGSTQGGSAVLQSVRNNMQALRDSLVMSGLFFGWPVTVSGGTPEQPTTFIYSKGVERVRSVVTWGTVGGASGNPQTIVYSYSSNSGTSYDTIGTKVVVYDANGNVTSTTWS